MLNIVKRFLFRKVHKNCSPICATCEVEISERTAKAISKILFEKANQFSKDNNVSNQLRIQADLILKGNWIEEYEKLIIKEGDKYVTKKYF